MTRASKKGRGPLLAAGAAAAAAVTGGAVLKRRRSSTGRKVLGVSPPKLNLDGVSPRGLDLKPIGKQVYRAGELVETTGRRVSRLSGDVERVGRAAKKLGDSIS